MNLSIIIPVYKVEKYIGATLDSIVAQQQDAIEYEVVIVDDGTPDDSMSIVDRYVHKLPIHILHQDNQGLSVARNTGLKHAKGDYVWFVDSDDTIAGGIFQSLSPILSDIHCDIYGFSVKNVYGNGVEQIEEPCSRKGLGRDYIGRTWEGVELGKDMASGLAQRFVFRRKFLLDNSLWFKEGVIFEDVELIVRAKCKAKSIMLSDVISYNYYHRKSASIMSTLDMKSVYSLAEIIKSWDEFRSQYKWYDTRNSIVCSHAFARSCQILSMQQKVNNAEYGKFFHANRWRYTLKGILYFMQSIRHSPKKYIIRLFRLFINPKLNHA